MNRLHPGLSIEGMDRHVPAYFDIAKTMSEQLTADVMAVPREDPDRYDKIEWLYERYNAMKFAES